MEKKLLNKKRMNNINDNIEENVKESKDYIKKEGNDYEKEGIELLLDMDKDKDINENNDTNINEKNERDERDERNERKIPSKYFSMGNKNSDMNNLKNTSKNSIEIINENKDTLEILSSNFGYDKEERNIQSLIKPSSTHSIILSVPSLSRVEDLCNYYNIEEWNNVNIPNVRMKLIDYIEKPHEKETFKTLKVLYNNNINSNTNNNNNTNNTNIINVNSVNERNKFNLDNYVVREKKKINIYSDNDEVRRISNIYDDFPKNIFFKRNQEEANNSSFYTIFINPFKNKHRQIDTVVFFIMFLLVLRYLFRINGEGYNKFILNLFVNVVNNTENNIRNARIKIEVEMDILGLTLKNFSNKIEKSLLNKLKKPDYNVFEMEGNNVLFFNYTYMKIVFFKDVNIFTVKPEYNSSLNVGSFIPLTNTPFDGKDFNQVLFNPKNIDKRCFFYVVYAWELFKKNDGKAPKKLNRMVCKSKVVHSSFDWTMVDVNNIQEESLPLFCESNNVNIEIYEIQGNEIILRKYTCNGISKGVISMLVYKNHSMLIKNVEKFLKKILEEGVSLKCCSICKSFSSYSKEKLDKHIAKGCKEEEKAKKYDLPKKMYKMTFKNNINSFKARIEIYADFEAILNQSVLTEEDIKKGMMSKHQAYLIAIKIYDFGEYIYENHEEIHEKLFVGEKCVDEFLDYIVKISEYIIEEKNLQKKNVKLHESSTEVLTCFACGKQSKKMYSSIHYKEFFHFKCYNKFLNNIFSIKILFHNFKNYDSNLLIDDIFKRYTKIFTTCKTKEKYSCIKYCINDIFVTLFDSYAFLPQSLDSLSKTLKQERKVLLSYGNVFKYETLNKMKFPYEYIDCYEKLFEPNLPDQYLWYSNLTGKFITEEEYEICILIFNSYGCKNILDYAKIYVKNDVDLLSKVFINFREIAIKNYGLDPLHYVSLPGYAWDCLLKTSNVTLDILSDEKIVNAIMSNIRGGVSSVSKIRYYNKNQEESDTCVKYFDVNNLYGWSMCMKIPTGDFVMIEDVLNFNLEFIKKYNIKQNEKGYLFCVDLDYPKSLHEEHVEFPFMCEKINKFLCLSLNDKRNYLCHIQNLQQALSHGLILIKVHYVIEFSHSYWMKDYIHQNTEKRNESETKAEKDFYKLMNNSVYGKSIENPTKRVSFETFSINDEDKINKAMKSKYFVKKENITENIVLVKNDKKKIMDKPIYVGFVVLEHSKYLMYKLFYECIKKLWKNGTLLYTDTDSFIYKIPLKISEINYKNYENYFKEGVLGAMKDEYPNKEIINFIAVRSKLYIIGFNDNTFNVKSKGIRSNIPISLEEFNSCLFEEKGTRAQQVKISSKNHSIFTQSLEKVALPLVGIDKKRLMHPIDKTITFPLGYSKITEIYEEFNILNKPNIGFLSDKIIKKSNINSNIN